MNTPVRKRKQPSPPLKPARVVAPVVAQKAAKEAAKKVASPTPPTKSTKAAVPHKMSAHDKAMKGVKASAEGKAAAKAERKRKFIEVFEAVACNISAACKAINITRQCYLNWKTEDAHFAKSINEAQEAMIDYAESMLMKKIKSEDNTAIIFFLKCKAKDRGYIERVEHSGVNGGPINHKHGVDLDWLNEELPAQALSSIVRKLGGNL
jgi:hypothetical protein